MASLLTGLSQDKALPLIGKPLLDVDKLPEDIKRRINALRYYQDKHEKLEAKFQEEILALEKKYLKEYTPLYEIRAKIVQGENEPTQDIVEAGVKLDEEEKKKLGEKSEEEEDTTTKATTVIENEKKTETNDERISKGIPEFWLTAMKHLISVADIITVNDEEALKYLVDIKITYPEKPGFELTFEFEENPFFTNKILKKTYFYRDEPGYGGEFVYDHAKGTEINWKEGKNLTKTVKKKTQKHKGNGYINYYYYFYF